MDWDCRTGGSDTGTEGHTDPDSPHTRIKKVSCFPVLEKEFFAVVPLVLRAVCLSTLTFTMLPLLHFYVALHSSSSFPVPAVTGGGAPGQGAALLRW